MGDLFGFGIRSLQGLRRPRLAGVTPAERLCRRLSPPGIAAAGRSWAAAIMGLVVMAMVSRAGAADLDEIVAGKVLRVALPASDLLPFVGTHTDGTLVGFEGDMIRDVARRLNVRLEFLRASRNGEELIEAVRERRVDVALGQLTDSLEWAKTVRFTTPHLTLFEARLISRLAAARAGGAGRLLADPQTRIALSNGSAVFATLREEFGADRLRVMPTLAAAIAEVDSGRAVAVSGDEVAIGAWMRVHAETGIRMETHLRRDHPLGIVMAVHWKAENLQAWLNLYVEKCANDETLRKLRAKYLGEARMRQER